MKEAIILVPIGPVPAGLLVWLAGQLEGVFGRHMIVAEAVPLPAAGYDSRRRQY
jgi:hypothetical protein